ncbi:MAG: hypothetical protein Q4G05_03670 [Clostridia bacterium]|nr:hypothetical protein [Clostridia bacterium]
MDGGLASEKTSVGTEVAPQNSPCIVNNAQIDIKGGTISTCLYGGGQGYSYTKDVVMNVSGNANISGWVTAGGSNGRTDNAKVNIKGGTINVFQTINRGSMISANVTVSGGTITKLYAGGETGDAGVTGRFLSSGSITVDIESGTVTSLFTGTNGGTVIAPNTEYLKVFYKTSSVGNNGSIASAFGTSAKAYTANNTIKEEVEEPVTLEKELFNALSESGASYIVSTSDYSWEFTGSNITNTDIDVDLEIGITQTAPETIKSDIEKLITDDAEVVFINFAHHGQLPGKAKVQIDVSEKYANGTKLYIAHYNEVTKKLEDCKEVIVQDGKITIEITSCSSYTLSKTNLLAVDGENEEVKEKPEKIVNDNNEGKSDKDQTPKTGVNDFLKIPMIIMSLAGLAIIILNRRKRI